MENYCLINSKVLIYTVPSVAHHLSTQPRTELFLDSNSYNQSGNNTLFHSFILEDFVDWSFPENDITEGKQNRREKDHNNLLQSAGFGSYKVPLPLTQASELLYNLPFCLNFYSLFTRRLISLAITLLGIFSYWPQNLVLWTFDSRVNAWSKSGFYSDHQSYS